MLWIKILISYIYQFLLNWSIDLKEFQSNKYLKCFFVVIFVGNWQTDSNIYMEAQGPRIAKTIFKKNSKAWVLYHQISRLIMKL